MQHNKVLIAFDFDHTVVDDNTDTAITGPAPLPEEVSGKYEPGR